MVFSYSTLPQRIGCQCSSRYLEVRLVFLPICTNQPMMRTSVLVIRIRVGWHPELRSDSNTQLRGNQRMFLVQISDHMGVEVGLAVPGEYSFSFNGTWVNTNSDPDSSLITLSWQLDSTLRISRLCLYLYNGSTRTTRNSSIDSSAG